MSITYLFSFGAHLLCSSVRPQALILFNNVGEPQCGLSSICESQRKNFLQPPSSTQATPLVQLQFSTALLFYDHFLLFQLIFKFYKPRKRLTRWQS